MKYGRVILLVILGCMIHRPAVADSDPVASVQTPDRLNRETVRTQARQLVARPALPVSRTDEISTNEISPERIANLTAAYQLFRSLVLDAKHGDPELPDDFSAAVQCLSELNHEHEIDRLLEHTLTLHAGNWRVMERASEELADSVPRFGVLLDGEFRRGADGVDSTFTTEYSCERRDGVRRIQLMWAAVELAEQDTTLPPGDLATLYRKLADTLFSGNESNNQSFWKPDTLTDLTHLPDIEPQDDYWKQKPDPPPTVYQTQFAADGEPLAYRLPVSWQAALTDGQRWRWAMQRVMNLAPTRQSEVEISLANKYFEEYDEQAIFQLQHNGDRLQLPPDVDHSDLPRRVFRSLGDNEALLAESTAVDTPKISAVRFGNSGMSPLRNRITIRRCTLPDHLSPIAILQRVAERRDAYESAALVSLLEVRSLRQQHDKTAEVLRRLVTSEPNNNSSAVNEEFHHSSDSHVTSYPTQLDQILGHSVHITSVDVGSPGEESTLQLNYRNGSRVTVELCPIDEAGLVEEFQRWLEHTPVSLRRDQINVDNFAGLLFRRPRTSQDRSWGFPTDTDSETTKVVDSTPPEGYFQRFIKPSIRIWTEELPAAPNHDAATHTIKVPPLLHGTYQVRVQMENGNNAFAILRMQSLAVLNFPFADRNLLVVADPQTGHPVANARVVFFGYHGDNNHRPPRLPEIRRASAVSDSRGLLACPISGPEQFSWQVTVRTDDGRFGCGSPDLRDIRSDDYRLLPHQIPDHLTSAAFGHFDRPLHRPGQLLKYHFWIRRPGTQEEPPRYANRSIVLTISSPHGIPVHESTMTSDKWAGIDGEWQIPADASPGEYRMDLSALSHDGISYSGVPFEIGSGSFRVEEYRKPEFDVRVAVRPGTADAGPSVSDHFAAARAVHISVDARYFFGTPVADAAVHYRITAVDDQPARFPVREWDWLYGNGYWWKGPWPEWFREQDRWSGLSDDDSVTFGGDEEDLIVEGNGTLQLDGRFSFDFDPSEWMYFVDDQSTFRIVAEVTDRSRRTEVGEVTFSSAPISERLLVQTDRGFYHPGEQAALSINALDSQGTPLSGKGTAVVLEPGTAAEESASESGRSVSFVTDSAGHTVLPFEVSRTGQYRIQVSFKSDTGIEQQSDCRFFVIGKKPGAEDRSTEAEFRPLEIISQKAEYGPVEKVILQIHTAQPDSRVWLVVYSWNSDTSSLDTSEPILVPLTGRTTTWTLDTRPHFAPDFFVQGITIADGVIYSAGCDVFVPPTEHMARVEIQPGAERFRPGDEAEVRLKLTDLNGSPYSGTAVISVYDASIETIGHVSFPDIRRVFWNMPRIRRGIRSDSTPLSARSWSSFSPQDFPDLEDNHYFRNNRWSGGGGGGFGGAGGFGGEVFGGGTPGSLTQASWSTVNADSTDQVIPESFAPAVLRTSFHDTAFWTGSAVPDSTGQVEIHFRIPDNLTTWRIRASTMGVGTRVGAATSSVISTKQLLLRPQLPRFLTQNDQLTVSAVVHNEFTEPKTCRVLLAPQNNTFALQSDSAQTVTIPAGGNCRVDWKIRVTSVGTATFHVEALTDEESDAVDVSVPVHISGFQTTQTVTAELTAEQESASVTVTVPENRVIDQSRFEVRICPSLAGSMREALPFLLEYPHGCAEQTLNRFLPAVITQHTLKRLRMSLEDIANASNFDDSADEEADGNGAHNRWLRGNGLADATLLTDSLVQRYVAAGYSRLMQLQNSDGGWSWFGDRESSADITAQVTYGLLLQSRIASDHGESGTTELGERTDQQRQELLAGGLRWLADYQREQLEIIRQSAREHSSKSDVPEAQSEPQNSDRRTGTSKKHHGDDLDALIAFVLAERDRPEDADDPENDSTEDEDDGPEDNPVIDNVHQDTQTSGAAEPTNPTILDILYRDRNRLLVHSRVLLALTLQARNDIDRCATVTQELEQFVQQDDATQLIELHLPNADDVAGPVTRYETMARYLQLLVRNGNTQRATQLARYLINHRPNGYYWESTRDTAIVIEALSELTVRSGDSLEEMSIDVMLDGTLQDTIRFSPNHPATHAPVFLLQADSLTPGPHEIQVRRRGRGALSVNVVSTHVIENDRIVANTGPLSIQRRYHIITGDTSKPSTPVTGVGSSADPLVITSGDLLEVELVVHSQSPLDYILIEDRLPSGFETHGPPESGDSKDGNLWREVRDDRVCFYLDHLDLGKQTLRYQLRAETPGPQMTAMPARVESMYRPELSGHSDSVIFTVEERR
jgi:hypothetical protein